MPELGEIRYRGTSGQAIYTGALWITIADERILLNLQRYINEICASGPFLPFIGETRYMSYPSESPPYSVFTQQGWIFGDDIYNVERLAWEAIYNYAPYREEARLPMQRPEYQQVPSHSRSIESSPVLDAVRETFRDLISSQGLERAQGQDLDNIGNILGQRRMHNWPGGIGRAIEPDDQYRNRLTSNTNAYRASQNADSRLRDAIASHLPAGLSLNDIQITQSETDPNQIDINLQLQPPPGAQHVALEIETEDESKIPDDIDRWQQIADEL